MSQTPATATIRRLKTRPEFLAVADARRKAAVHGLVLQGRPRGDGQSAIGIGFTATRKVGGSVVRNRARRRLREAARAVLATRGLAGWDYVAIARDATGERPFPDLIADFERALALLAKEGA
ncbi:MAG: ribonuclease P protein component [Tagaea sp.]